MVEFKSDSSFSRILRNGVFTALRFGVYAVSSVVLIRFFVLQYGRSSFGLIALAGILTQFVGLISGCVGTSVARFLNVALNKNDWHQANEIFSTSIVANLGFIGLQLPLFALGVWKLDWLIDFPEEIATDFRILVVCNIAVFVLNIVKGAIFAPIQAANRIDINEKFDIVAQLIRLILLFGLISQIGAKLWIIGAVELGVSVLVGMAGLVVYKRLVGHMLVFRKKYITWKWALPVMNMAGWSLVSTLGFALFVKTDIWIINRFVSKEMAGVYAALLVWPNFIKQIGGQLSALLGPVYVIDYAKQNTERMVGVCLFTSKLLGYFAAIAVGFIFVFAEDILSIWLGAEFIQFAPLLKLMTCSLILTLSETVIWGIFPAINKMHYTGWANLVPGLLNIGLSIALVFAGYGVYGVAIGTIVSTLLKSAIILPYGLSREMHVPFSVFLMNYAKSAGLFALVLLAGVGINLLPGVLVGRLALFALTMLALAPLVYWIGFSQKERGQIEDQASKLFKRTPPIVAQ
jgi:membrane protein EpsK